jgi:hypothetical protein
MIDASLPDEAGDALAHLAIEWLRERGVSSISHMRDPAAPASFWERLGFRPDMLRLADTGRAVISVPNPYNWVEVARELFGRHDPEGHLSSFSTPVMQNLAGLSEFRIDRRLGTSIRIPKTSRLISSDSILARSRMYVLRPSKDHIFAGLP